MTFNEAKAKAVKDLQEDKETLKHCLEFEPYQNLVRGELNDKEALLYITIDKWWKAEQRVLTVARILDRYGQLKSISETIDFFEKPYNFEEKMKFIVENM